MPDYDVTASTLAFISAGGMWGRPQEDERKKAESRKDMSFPDITGYTLRAHLELHLDIARTPFEHA